MEVLRVTTELAAQLFADWLLGDGLNPYLCSCFTCGREDSLDNVVRAGTPMKPAG